jgi:uncharacterized Zn finger protein
MNAVYCPICGRGETGAELIKAESVMSLIDVMSGCGAKADSLITFYKRSSVPSTSFCYGCFRNGQKIGCL